MRMRDRSVVLLSCLRYSLSKVEVVKTEELKLSMMVLKQMKWGGVCMKGGPAHRYTCVPVTHIKLLSR